MLCVDGEKCLKNVAKFRKTLKTRFTKKQNYACIPHTIIHASIFINQKVNSIFKSATFTKNNQHVDNYQVCIQL